MKLFYRLARAVMGGVFTLGGIRILGKENIPDDNGLLIISNHVSYADPPAVSWAYHVYRKRVVGSKFFSSTSFGGFRRCVPGT